MNFNLNPQLNQIIMKKRMIMWACVSLLFGACQQKEDFVSDETDKAGIVLEASVASPVGTRTETDSENAVTSFVVNDKIGFFMPDEEVPVEWTLTDGGWESAESLVWENKVDEFEFCAYYPSVEKAVRSAIPMPDLTAQTGQFSGLGDFDFLVARRLAGYDSNSGIVAFVEDYAFRHVYSLLSITLKANESLGSIQMSKAIVKGDGLFSQSTYHFGETSQDDGISYLEEKSVNQCMLEYNSPVELSGPDGHTLAVLCNPRDLDSNAELEITYQRDGVTYIASTSGLGDSFKSGVQYKLVIRIEKEGLYIEGQEITGWSEEELPPIMINEGEVQ